MRPSFCTAAAGILSRVMEAALDLSWSCTASGAEWSARSWQTSASSTWSAAARRPASRSAAEGPWNLPTAWARSATKRGTARLQLASVVEVRGFVFGAVMEGGRSSLWSHLHLELHRDGEGDEEGKLKCCSLVVVAVVESHCSSSLRRHLQHGRRRFLVAGASVGAHGRGGGSSGTAAAIPPPM